MAETEKTETESVGQRHGRLAAVGNTDLESCRSGCSHGPNFQEKWDCLLSPGLSALLLGQLEAWLASLHQVETIVVCLAVAESYTNERFL